MTGDEIRALLSFPPLTHLGRIIEDAPAHLDPLLPLPRRQILLRLRLRDVVQTEVVRPRRRALVGPGLDGELDVPLDRQPPLEDGIHPAVRGGHLPDGGGGAEHTIVLFGGMEGSLSASVPAAYRPRSVRRDDVGVVDDIVFLVRLRPYRTIRLAVGEFC